MTAPLAPKPRASAPNGQSRFHAGRQTQPFAWVSTAAAAGNLHKARETDGLAQQLPQAFKSMPARTPPAAIAVVAALERPHGASRPPRQSDTAATAAMR